MKSLVLLSFAYLISGNPIVPAAKLPRKFPIGPDNLILHEIASLAINVTKGAIPNLPNVEMDENLEPFHHSHLACVSEDVRHRIRICYNRVLDAVVLSRLFMDCHPVDSREYHQSNESEETMPSSLDGLSQLPLPVTIECVLNGLEAVDITQGRINLTIVKDRIINSVVLSPSEMSLANVKFDECVFSNLTLPDQNFGIKNKALPDSIFKFHMLGLKTVVCAAQALMNNGCGTEREPSSFGRSMLTSTSSPEMTFIAETSIQVTPPSIDATSTGVAAEGR